MPNYPGAIERKLGDKLGERISVRDFGAVGDGETDDTSAIQAAIDCAQDNGGLKIGAVYIPAGHYRISETLLISEALVFGGETSHSARFIYTGTDAAVRVERKRPVAPGSSTWIYRVYLHDFLVVSSQGWDVAGTGIHLHELSEFELRNVGVGQGPDNGFGVGIACSVDIGVFHGVLLGGNHVSISLDHFDPDGSLPGGICTSIEICGMSNLFVTDTAIRVRGLADAHIHDCWFELFHSAILIDNDETGDCAVHNVTLDNNAFAGYNHTTSQYSFTDNRVFRLQHTDAAKHISVINFRIQDNSCFIQGTHVISFSFPTPSPLQSGISGFHVNRNELWGGSVAAIGSNADDPARVLIVVSENDSRSAFYGAKVPDVDADASLMAQGMETKAMDYAYLHFRRGIKTRDSNKFYAANGDVLYLEGDEKAYISFYPDVATEQLRGMIGFPTPTSIAYAMQIISALYGAPIVLQAQAAPVLVNTSAFETRSGAGECSFGGSVYPTFGGGYRQQAIVNTSSGGAVAWIQGYKFVAGALDGKPVSVNGVPYTFTFVSDTQGTLSPDPGDQAGVPFRLDDYKDIGSLAFGNGTGYKYVIGTRGVDGLFKPLFRFYDNGRLEFAEVGASILAGAGTPEGHVAAGAGSIYLRTDDAAAGSAIYIKQSGDGLTGWLSSSEAVLADVGTPGTYTKVTVDAKGRVTEGAVVDLSGEDVTGILAPERMPGLTGDVTSVAGGVEISVATVGGSTAALIHAAEEAANAATAFPTPSVIAKRDSNGNFFINEVLAYGVGAGMRWQLASYSPDRDFNIFSYNDSGGYLGCPLWIKRGTGKIVLDSLSVSLPVKTNAGKELISEAIDLSGAEATGILAAERMPGLTGDVTSAAGGVETSIASVGGTPVADVVAAVAAVTEATASAIPSRIAKRDVNGNFFIVNTLVFGEGPNHRWSILSGNAESGGNSGSDLTIYSYNDAGAYLGGPVSIKRATGRVALDSLTVSLPVKTNPSKELISGAIDLSGAEATGIMAAARMPALAGDVTSGAGGVDTVVASVGGSTAALVHAAEVLANAATSTNTANAIMRRDGSGNFYSTSAYLSTSIKVGGTGVGYLQLITGSASLTAYIEWRKADGTRVGYLGSSSAHMALVLENGAAFTVSGGGMYVYSPVNGSFGVVTCDGVQTLTNKSIAASQLTGTLQAAQHPALTGDVTCPAGSTATTLATVVAAGTYNYVTVDAKGRVVGGSYVGYMLGGNNLSEVTNAATARANIGAAKVGGSGTTTLTLAKITPGGVNGSISFNSDGVVVGYAQPS